MKLCIRKRIDTHALFSRDWFTYSHSRRFRYGPFFWRTEGTPAVMCRINGKRKGMPVLVKAGFIQRTRQ